MELEQIAETLKEKVGQTSFSDRTILSYVENNLPQEGEEPDDDYWTKHVNIIKTFHGNFGKDLSDILAKQLPQKSVEYLDKNPDAIKEYLSKHPEFLKKETPEPKPEPKDDKYEALMAEFKAMRDEMAAEKNAKKAAELKAGVYRMAKEQELPLNEELWNDAVNSASGETIEELFKSAKANYSAKYKKVFVGDEPFTGSPTPAYSGTNKSKTVKELFDKKKQRLGIK